MIYSWVVPKKNQTPPTEEIFAIQGGKGESYKGCIEFVQDVHKGEGGGVLIFSMGGMDIFWNNPFCGNIRKKLLSRNKIPCIFNCSNKNLSTKFFC